MNIIVLDFETFFSDDYTLSKMTTEAYVRDQRFEAMGVGVKTPTYTIFASGADINRQLDTMDWSLPVLCHHAAFDGLILSHHYDIRPAQFLDTYSMAQYVFGPGQSKGLGALAARFGLAPKTMPYDLVRGRHWADLSAPERQLVADGCLQDVTLTHRIFELMMTGDY